MIRLARDRSAGRIHPGFRGPLRVAKMLALLDGHLRDDARFLDSWKVVKDQLRAESAGKCAYCEASTDVVAYGDVEHFRPKSRYWWLAYCYENYVFACQICNQAYKSDQFPVHGPAMTCPPIPAEALGLTEVERRAIAARLAPDPLDDAAGRPRAEFLRAAAREKAGLVDPYVDDPESLFKWVADPIQRRVAIAPRHPRRAASRRVFEAAERCLGLNRDELLGLRYRKYADLETFRLVLDSGKFEGLMLDRISAQVRAMTAPDAEFAGMCRYFVRDVWKLVV
ncbi:hypothetical protein [Paludisphaera mucosa]|uniref:TIGR02646 family protein n=1 Tax=Paludisphaera mucosa TaxID=3030827 RepID=A0ABT6FJ77_9BACT|nr:hypothetical protein [Paludisphaera mucosa]MDG3007632.1 hypothetical protein [Paludisphaera mucosa]